VPEPELGAQGAVAVGALVLVGSAAVQRTASS
jgi:hypothetical protein